MAQAPLASELLYSRLNMIDEFTSLFPRRQLLQVRLGKLYHRSMPLWSVFFCGCASNGQVSPKASPRVIFSWKNFIEQLNLIAHMNADWKVEKAQYAEFNVPTCGKIAVSQLCKERQPLWNSHDSWWPQLKMFGSMPWCSSPGYKFFRVNALLYNTAV